MKFNTQGTTSGRFSAKAFGTGYEGAPVFEQTPKIELYQAVATCMFGEDKYYEKGDDRAIRVRSLIETLVSKNQGLFVAQLAVYAREKLYLRSIPLYLIVTLAEVLRDKGTKFDAMRKAVARIISRADELTEVYALALSKFGNKKSVPQAIKKGVADAFDKFDEYQFAKYRRADSTVKLKDIVQIVHPVPKNHEQSELFRRILEDSLKTPDTWETKISTKGSTTENWQEVANNPRTGYMALLRNLRNFLDHKVDVTNVLRRLRDPNEVRKSKQLPFRFYTAYRELGGNLEGTTNRYGWSTPTPVVSPDTGRVLAALEDAFDISVENIPDLGNVLVITDQSASMRSPISGNSTMTMREIASVMGAAVWASAVRKGRNAAAIGFADQAKLFTASHRTTALALAKEMIQAELGGSTSVWAAWDIAKQQGIQADTIILFTDMQFQSFLGGYAYGYGSIKHSQHNMEPEHWNIASGKTQKVLVDIQGYGKNPFAETSGWTQLAGWSDKIFDLLEMRHSKDEAIQQIEAITLN